MFVIPLIGKISLKNPPVITIAIVLVNCYVFFVIQADDRKNWHNAMEYYAKSGLAKIELTRYIEYYKSKHPDADYLEYKEELDRETLRELYLEMWNDREYRNKLNRGEIITREDPDFDTWNELKTEYKLKLQSITSNRYGFIPAERKPVTFLTHMFLHGSPGHLIGNMIMFWLVGCILEFGCGRALYTGIYLVGGILSVTVFWLFSLGSTIPLVGASGAISGLMGAVTVLFGKKKINILLFAGIMFYLKIPAILLLPFWLGNEIYQQLTYGHISNVAYMAHAGGLGGGALLGFLGLKYMNFSKRDVFEEEVPDEVLVLMEKALDAVGELDHDKARGYLNQILLKDPRNLEAMTRLHDIEKYNPESQRFHTITGKLIFELSQDKTRQKEAYDIYSDYKDLVKQQRLSLPVYLRISSICAETGNPDMSLKILSLLLKKKADMPGIPAALLKLAESYRRTGNRDNWRKCLKVIPSKYPLSSEAGIAKRMLEG